MKIYCPQCEAENAEDAPVCGLCGHLLNATARPIERRTTIKPKRRLVVRKRRMETMFKLAAVIGIAVVAILGIHSWLIEDTGQDMSIWIVGVYVLGFALAVIVVAGVWLIPVFVAKNRHHPNETAIFAVTVLFGWTFLGWGIALVWALSNPPPKPGP